MPMTVIVRFRFEGIHRWGGCPLEQVSFLRDFHRHEFHVEARKPVSHDDRDVEIIMLKRDMQAYCAAELKGPHGMSCELMARMLLERYALSSCSVTEDGENGAEVTA